MAAVDLTKLIDFNLLQRYDTKLKAWTEQKIIEANEIVFTTNNSLPVTGSMSLLYVTEDSILLWDGSEYIKVGGQGTGTTFIPSIDSNGDLTWTNDGGLTNPQPVNVRGPEGKDAYEIAVENGFVGDKNAWLESLKGKDGVIGEDGKSAYDLAVEKGFKGTEEEWLESLKGDNGDDGQTGKSAYEIAVDNGFTGSEADWLESLKGANGVNGASFTIKGLYPTYDDLISAHPTGEAGDAYAVGDSDYNEIYNWSVDNQEWENLGSLEGPPGPKGEDSTVPGPKGEDGVSPTIKVETTDNGVDVTVKDVDGEQTFNLTNGAKGEDGKNAYELAVAAGYEGDEASWLESLKGADGEPGEDGVSPTVSLNPIDNGTEVIVTDENGAKSFEVKNGEVGKDGPSIVSMRIDENYHLISTMSNGVEIDAGKIEIEGLTIEKTEVIDVKLMTELLTFDGATTQFILPVESKTLMVFVNGICLKEDLDYTIVDGNITFNETFDATDIGVLHWLDKNSADSSDTLWATKEDIDKMFNTSGEPGEDTSWATKADIDKLFN